MTWLRLLAFIPLACAPRLGRVERRIMTRLTDAGANTAERAILLDGQGLVANFVKWRLERAGVLQPAANDRYYLDEAAYRAFRRRRRRRALIIVAILLGGLMAIYFRGDFS